MDSNDVLRAGYVHQSVPPSPYVVAKRNIPSAVFGFSFFAIRGHGGHEKKDESDLKNRVGILSFVMRLIAMRVATVVCHASECIVLLMGKVLVNHFADF